MDPMQQQLREENEDLQRALLAIETNLQTVIAEKEQITALYSDFKQHYDSMKTQSGQYQKRLAEEMQARREIEINQEQRIGDMRRAIEQKQREIEQMQAKMTLPIDTDILRMKIQKDLEARHRVELDQKQQENDRLSQSYYEAKRQLDVVKTQLETVKFEGEKESTDLREKSRQEMHEMMLENQALQARVDDKRDRELIRQLRRDLDEHKRRTTELLGEATDLRRERDLLKLEKNEQMIQFTKDLEEERNQKRVLQSDLDRAVFKLQVSDQDYQKLQIKLEKKTQEAHSQLNEKNTMNSLLREKDAMIDTLSKQLAQLKEELRLKDFEIGQVIKKTSEEDKERQTLERKEKSKLQKDFENLERKYNELESQKRTDLSATQNEFERMQRDYRVLQEERKMMTQKIQEFQTEYETMKLTLEKKSEEFDVVERELRKLQEKYREALQNEYNLSKDKDHLEASLKIAQEEVRQYSSQYEEHIAQLKHEKGDVQGRYQDLLVNSERFKAETGRQLQNYKQKYSDYKNKLKKANLSIQTLTSRIAKYELQLAAERDDRFSGREGGQENRNYNRYSSQRLLGQGSEPGLNVMQMMQNDPLNVEISKLVEEANRGGIGSGGPQNF